MSLVSLLLRESLVLLIVVVGYRMIILLLNSLIVKILALPPVEPRLLSVFFSVLGAIVMLRLVWQWYRRVYELQLGAYEIVGITQGPVAKLFNYGSLQLKKDEGVLLVTNIHNPHEIAKKLMKQNEVEQKPKSTVHTQGLEPGVTITINR